MATLIDTAGATDANTYCSVADADTYLEEFRGHTSDWSSATDGDKGIALLWATILIDQKCNWKGQKVTDTQALRWPRSFIYDQDGYSTDNTTIPTWLARATAEYAFFLLQEDLTVETNRDLVGISELKAGPIELKIDRIAKKASLPPSVWAMVSFYASRYGRSKTLVRM